VPSYAWTADAVPVGTDSASYTPVAADQGKEIGCKVTISNFIGSASATSSTVTVGTIPTFVDDAEISGAAGALGAVGDELGCAATAGGDPSPTVSYAWFRDAALIVVGDTYEVNLADAGHEVKCVATAASVAGSVSSSAAVAVGSVPKDGAPTLSGQAKVGSTLSCAPGTWTAIPKATLGLAWLRNGAPIAGASGGTYVTTLGDIGAAIACEATASNELGSAKASSAAITVEAAPAAIVPKAAGAGKVSGKLALLATLGCDVGPCAVKAPKQVKVTIGGESFLVKVLVPATIEGGQSAPVKLALTKAAKTALKKAGQSAKFSVTLTIEGGGASTVQKLTLRLKA
jgi:hypothetical protein